MHRLRASLPFVFLLITVACSPAPRADRVVIYSGRSEAFVQPVLDAFAAAHPEITVDIKYGKNTELAALIAAEKSSPLADIFLTTDMLVPLGAVENGIFAETDIPGTAAIPAALRDSRGRWYSVTARGRVILYNTDLVTAAEVPQSMLAVTDPRWRGKVAFADASNGPFQAQVAGMMLLLGQERTTAWLQALVANDTHFLASATDLRTAVGNGEFAIGVANHYHYELQRREASGNHVGIVFPDQAADEMGVFLNSATVSIVAGAPHRSAAETFAAFLFTPEIQRLFADVNYEFPVVPGVTITSGATQIDDFRPAAVAMDRAASLAPTAISLMQAAGIP